MSSSIEGWQVLVVEDDYSIAIGMKADLERLGARVIGPASNVRKALILIDETEHLDAAVLDVTLGDEQSFPIALALQSKGIAFLFTTGYDSDTIAPKWQHVPIVSKPTRLAILIQRLVQVVDDGAGKQTALQSAPTNIAPDTLTTDALHEPSNEVSTRTFCRPVADICHQLRNSLASISIAADILQCGDTDSTRTPVVAAKISTHVYHMAELINELLTNSKGRS